MPADHITPITTAESRLIFSLLKEGSLGPLYDKGFSPNYITSGEGQSVFNYVIDHVNEHGKTPSLERVQTDLQVTLTRTNDALSEVISDLRDSALLGTTTSSIQELAMLLKQAKTGSMSSKKAASSAVALVKNLSIAFDSLSVGTKDIELSEQLNPFLDKLDERRDNDGISGYPFPWESINEYTNGVEDSQLIVIIARTGVGKTWLLVYIAIRLMLARKLKILLVTNEISNTGVCDRVVSIGTGIPYSKIRSGRIDASERQSIVEFFNKLNTNSDDCCFVIAGTDGMGVGGIGSIENKAKSIGADIIFVDGAYLLSDDRGATSRIERAANIARDLKLLAKRLDVPVLISWQFNRGGSKDKGGSTEDIGLTDVLGHDSDLIISAHRDEDMELAKRTTLSSVKTRECQPFSTDINWNFDTMEFSEIPIDEDDIDFDDAIEHDHTTTLFDF